MPIRVIKKNKRFFLHTKNTTYAFEVFNAHYLLHRHYGKRLTRLSEYEQAKMAFSPNELGFNSASSPDVLPCEVSFFGSGDFRPTALRICGSDGSSVTDFRYKGFRVFEGRRDIDGLPFARADENTETLEIHMTDKVSGCDLYLYYTVFPDTDVISRYMTVVNNGKDTVKIEKCMPMELCIRDAESMDMVTLWGGHMRECNYQRVPLSHGCQSVGSRRGASSHQYNPFMALCSHSATEEKGDAYGFNLVYSGSFLDEVELDQQNTVKALMGLGSECFSYTLGVGETFESPEVVMTYSSSGLGKMTRNFHSFVRGNIMPKTALKPHPVVLNTWEACYFNIDAEKLVRFAQKANEMGFDMLVMDDGWFGARNNDSAGLGDWYVNREKFPMGLKSFVDSVRAEGVKFGIWVEPEMVNPDSELYRAHPEWCIRVPKREPLYSRRQLILDMGNDEVIEYLKGIFFKTFDGVAIDYFKWDMNRHMCNVCVSSLPASRQGEAAFRYMKGVYRLMNWFVSTFPNAVIETCSGGGGRYDLGMMPSGIQIWTSDNTNPYSRTMIQSGALTAYPAATMSCHVSNPHENMKSLDYRYKVALGGMLGYELNVLEMPDEINSEIKRQIAEYRTFEHVMRLGEYYSLVSPFKSGYAAYYYSYADGSELVLTVIERKGCPAGNTKLLKLKTADGDATYTDMLTGRAYTGADLRHGISVALTGEDDTANIFYFKKQ